ncbi:hypothetical protein GE061_008446, partial [Apolygus lucorum]
KVGTSFPPLTNIPLQTESPAEEFLVYPRPNGSEINENHVLVEQSSFFESAKEEDPTALMVEETPKDGKLVCDDPPLSDTEVHSRNHFPEGAVTQPCDISSNSSEDFEESFSVAAKEYGIDSLDSTSDPEYDPEVDLSDITVESDDNDDKKRLRISSIASMFSICCESEAEPITSADNRTNKSMSSKFVNTFEKNPGIQRTVSIFMDHNATPDQVADAGAQFIAAVYSSASNTPLNDLRLHHFEKALSKVNFSLASLPPTAAAARQHSLRVYLQVQLWKGTAMDPKKKIHSRQVLGSTGDPLFLTPYIESGREEDGRRAAEVPPILDNVQSYAGYLTINKTFNSNMFFWYFPAENSPETAPVILWLQGGPGESVLFGIFTEMGPFEVSRKLVASMREHRWSKDIHMIYIDNPVGTGFSFTKSSAGYVTNEDEVGRDLYAALVQFFQLFPELQPHEFFLAGESYGGKYAPALGYTIHVNNPTASLKINLKGLAIGAGFIDPVNMMKYGDYLVQHGLIDDEGLQQFHLIESNIVEAVENEQFLEASEHLDTIFTLMDNLTGSVDIYNYMNVGSPELDPTVLSKYLSQDQIRKRIHVGKMPWNDATKVEKYLKLDMAKSVKPWFQVLLEHYDVLLYNGQLDIVVAYPLTVNFLKKLEWSGASEYATAERKKWFVGDELAGYSKSVKNFTELMVRNAGHMVPLDQPKWAHEMIKKFVSHTPL